MGAFHRGGLPKSLLQHIFGYPFTWAAAFILGDPHLWGAAYVYGDPLMWEADHIYGDPHMWEAVDLTVTWQQGPKI